MEQIKKTNPPTRRTLERHGKVNAPRGGNIRDFKTRSINVEELNIQPENLTTGLAGQFALNNVDANGNAFIDMIAFGSIGEFTLVGSIIPAVDAGGIGLGSYLGSAGRAYGLVRSYSFSTASDERAKKDIADISYGLDTIEKIRPVSYKYKQGEDCTKLGFIAQEIKEHLPEVVDGSDETSYGVSYDELVPVLVKAVQELSARVKELEDNVV